MFWEKPLGNTILLHIKSKANIKQNRSGKMRPVSLSNISTTVFWDIPVVLWICRILIYDFTIPHLQLGN